MRGRRFGAVALVVSLLVIVSAALFSSPVFPQSSSGSPFHVFLPLVIRRAGPPAPTQTPTPTLPASGPAPGQWHGLTNLGKEMSFRVTDDSAHWADFTLCTTGRVGPCNVTITTTVFGPGAITNNQFARTFSTYSFSGQFVSPVAAVGFYTYTNHYVYGCGYFNQAGTWTANWP